MIELYHQKFVEQQLRLRILKMPLHKTGSHCKNQGKVVGWLDQIWNQLPSIKYLHNVFCKQAYVYLGPLIEQITYT